MNLYRIFVLFFILATSDASEIATVTIINGDVIDIIEVAKGEDGLLLYSGMKKIGHAKYENGTKFEEAGLHCEIKYDKIDEENYAVSINLIHKSFIEWKKKDDGYVPIIDSRKLTLKKSIKNGGSAELLRSVSGEKLTLYIIAFESK